MQRKVESGLVTFRQNWTDYREGFGEVAGNDNYWLGLDKIYRLIQMGSARLRVEVQKRKDLIFMAAYKKNYIEV